MNNIDRIKVGSAVHLLLKCTAEPTIVHFREIFRESTDFFEKFSHIAESL